MTVFQAPTPSTLIGVNVRDAMSCGVVTCLPDASLPAVAAHMATHGIHSVVLSEPERDTPLVVTDLELVRAAREAADDTCAGDIAREPAATIPSDASLDDAVAMMAVGHVAHVLATDPSSGAPVGIVSAFDVASVVAGWKPHLSRIMRPDPAMLPSARTLHETSVRDAMHRGVAKCMPNAQLADVARSMAAHRVHCVAVASADKMGGGGGRHTTWRLIDDLDFVVALHGGSLEAPAGTLALPPAVSLPESASLDHAAALMVEHTTRHVMAVNESGLPSGMVSTLDVAWVLAWSR